MRDGVAEGHNKGSAPPCRCLPVSPAASLRVANHVCRSGSASAPRTSSPRSSPSSRASLPPRTATSDESCWSGRGWGGGGVGWHTVRVAARAPPTHAVSCAADALLRPPPPQRRGAGQGLPRHPLGVPRPGPVHPGADAEKHGRAGAQDRGPVRGAWARPLCRTRIRRPCFLQARNLPSPCSTLSSQLLKHLAALQSDPEPGIRANTAILLGNIAKHLGPDTCRKVLLDAFSKSLRDPFPPSRSGECSDASHGFGSPPRVLRDVASRVPSQRPSAPSPPPWSTTPPASSPSASCPPLPVLPSTPTGA